MNKAKLVYRTVVMVLAFAVTLSATIAYARYREELEADQGFVAKPLEIVSLDADSWQYEDGKYVMQFTVEESVEACRVYVAVSNGVAEPEALQIVLVVPGQEETKYTALHDEIYRGTTLYSIFGPGYVYTFKDAKGTELNIGLTAGEQYTVSVDGLDAAAQKDCLLRVFVEGTK